MKLLEESHERKTLIALYPVMNFKSRDTGAVPERKGWSEDTQMKTSAEILMNNSRMSLSTGRAACRMSM